MDEFQIETFPEYAELVGETGVHAIELAGKHFGLACPTTGEYKVGKNWSETH